MNIIKRAVSFFTAMAVVLSLAVFPASALTAYTEYPYTMPSNDFFMTPATKEVSAYRGTKTEIIITYEAKTIADNGFANTPNYDHSKITSIIMYGGTYYGTEFGIWRIGKYAFSGCSSLKSITLPETLKQIDVGAFSGCISLKSVTIPYGVDSINMVTFLNCSSLTEVNLPSSIDNIGTRAFEGCTSLKKITIPRSVRTMNYDYNTNIGPFGGSSLETIILEPGISKITKYTFKGLFSLKYLAIPSSVTVIEEYAFDMRSSFTIYGEAGSYAEKYAKENGIPFKVGTPPEDNPNGSGSPAETVTVPSDEEGTSINLSAETVTLSDGFKVAAYSADGGKKWTKGALPTGDKLKKLFDKDLTLWIADKYNDRDVREGKTVIAKKGVPDDAKIIKFPTIKARPKANTEKLAPVYKADDKWWLAKKTDTSGTAVYSGYEYSKSSDGGKTFGEWLLVPKGGFALENAPAKGAKKTVYQFRNTASDENNINTAAGKTFKITPANYGKMLNYKIDYKNEIVKLKKGDQYSSDGTSWTDVTEQKGLALDVSGYITSGTKLMVRKANTGKSPRTETQTIEPVSRLTLADVTLACDKGKITTSLKDYEILGKDSKGNDKWSGSVPRITTEGTHTFSVRLKATAKLAKTTWTGGAASETTILTIKYGVYDDSGKTPKSGIVEAFIGKVSAPPAENEIVEANIEYTPDFSVENSIGEEYIFPNGSESVDGFRITEAS